MKYLTHLATSAATLVVALVAFVAAATTAAAQQTTPADSAHHARTGTHAMTHTATRTATHTATHTTKHHVSGSAAMRAEAKIGEDSATVIALAQVPDGKVRSGELEREHGKLIYSFDIEVAGKPGVEEVNVNALDGSIVAHEHEGPKAEAKEARQEAKEKAAAKKP